MKIISWNVNGIRAIQKKGFLPWLENEKPDILCLQETKAHPSQLETCLKDPPGYQSFFASAERKGYSGVAIYTRKKPLSIKSSIDIARFDVEGRVLIAEYETFTLLNIYFPNGNRDQERLRYKLDFYEAILHFVEDLKRTGKRVIVCGDYNTAHKPIDLARPEANEKVSGFLPEERAWLDRWIACGHVDIFREKCFLPNQYTWWDMKTRARDRNIGWRIDYHFVTQNLLKHVANATIHPEVMGSDHCPIGLQLQF